MLKFSFTQQRMSFGQWLKHKRREAGFSQERLAEQVTRAGQSVTGAYISMIEREYDKNKKGLPTRVNEDLVELIAQVLGTPIDEARLEAGWAPRRILSKPTNLPELIQALEDLGLPVPQLSDGWEALIKEEDGFEEALDRIRYDLEAVIRRIEKGRKRLRFETSTLPVADVDLDDLVGQHRRKIG